MKKIIFALSVFIFAFLLLFPSVASAKVITMKKGTVVIDKEEVVNDDLFVGAQTVEIYGTVNGDVYAGAETVRVDGNINGDLFVGAGTVSLSGTVKEDVYIGTGNATVSNATIGDSLLVGAGNVSIDKNSSIGGSLLAGSGSISVYAPVKRNVFAGAGTVDLNSVVGGEVRLGARNVIIGPDTKIAKDLYYAVAKDQNEIRISDSATVSGKIQKFEYKMAERTKLAPTKIGLTGASKTIGIFLQLMTLIGAIIVGVLCLRFFEKVFSSSANFVSGSFFKSLGVGLIISLLTIPVLIILVLTGVGIPLAGILFLIFILNLYLSKIVVGLSLGYLLTEKFGWKKLSKYAVLSLGLVTIYILFALPIIGLFTKLIVTWAGLGSLALFYKSNLASK